MNAVLDASPLRVVIIDDTEDLRELLRIALVRGGMEIVGEAGDGLAGIEAVRSADPDVVLLDLSMPVMDGLEALPRLRALAPDAKIIVLSGFGSDHMAEQALAQGADGYLQKGMSLNDILERVRTIAQGPATDAATGPRLHVVRPTPTPDPGPDLDVALAVAPYGVLEVDLEAPFRTIRANPAAARLLGRAPVVGHALESVSAEVARLVEARRVTGTDAFVTSHEGSGLRVTVRRAPRSLLLYLETYSDEIEELRRVMATTAHEIRGPITVLRALAETITHHEIDDPAQRSRLMSSVARQARVLDGITGDLLIGAQVERGVLRVELRPVDPVAAIGAAITDLQAPIALEVHDRRAVLADPLRLDQMLGNLARNAVKYGQPPLVIRVRADAADPRMMAIDVQDRGDGVPEDFQDRIFDEFAQAPGAATGGGIGLGLHVVRTLALAHGGSVTYSPGPDGAGAVFTLTLPTA